MECPIDRTLPNLESYALPLRHRSMMVVDGITTWPQLLFLEFNRFYSSQKPDVQIPILMQANHSSLRRLASQIETPFSTLVRLLSSATGSGLRRGLCRRCATLLRTPQVEAAKGLISNWLTRSGLPGSFGMFVAMVDDIIVVRMCDSTPKVQRNPLRYPQRKIILMVDVKICTQDVDNDTEASCPFPPSVK